MKEREETSPRVGWHMEERGGIDERHMATTNCRDVSHTLADTQQCADSGQPVSEPTTRVTRPDTYLKTRPDATGPTRPSRLTTAQDCTHGNAHVETTRSNVLVARVGA